MRLTQVEISSTLSKRAGAFHSITWRTVWISKVPSIAVGRPRQRRAHELEAGEIGILAVARVEHHVLGVAVLVAHAQVIAKRRSSCLGSRSAKRPVRRWIVRVSAPIARAGRRAATGSASSSTSRPRVAERLAARPRRAARCRGAMTTSSARSAASSALAIVGPPSTSTRVTPSLASDCSTASRCRLPVGVGRHVPRLHAARVVRRGVAFGRRR